MGKLSDIAKKIGAALVREVVPGGGLLLAAVNAALPADKQLPADATGDDLARLPPEVLAREFDVRVEEIKQSGETMRAMLEAESRSTHTTRPKIAMGAFQLTAAVTLIIVGAWAYAVLSGDAGMVEVIVGGWPFLLALVGPFVGWLNAYFGVLKTEHKNRLDAATGNSRPGGLEGAIRAFRRL